MSNVIEFPIPASDPNVARERFGEWSSWSPDEISYLLNTLSAGHWEDGGEKVPGFAIAMGGLNIAIAANDPEPGDSALRAILNGMWVAADYLVAVGEDAVDKRITASLAAVRAITEWTGEPDADALGVTKCDW